MDTRPKIVIPFRDIYESFYKHPDIAPVISHSVICEITRQTFQILENDFVNFAQKSKRFLNYDLVFKNKMNQEVLTILDYCCTETAVATYFLLHRHGLFDQRFRAVKDELDDSPRPDCPFDLELVTRDFLVLLLGVEMRVNRSVAAMPISNI